MTNLKEIPRSLELPTESSFFLFGPRQVGKTTLIRNTFIDSSTLYFDLLVLEEFIVLSTDPSAFRSQVEAKKDTIKHVVIDEIQKLPELLDEVHSLIEKYKSINFILSGSSARKLKNQGANLLGGRAWTLSLGPLTHQELKGDFDLKTALEYGTLPQIYLLAQSGRTMEAQKYLKSYVNTYLEEEIKAEAITRNLGSFLMFLKLAAQENGNILNYSTIARGINMEAHTVKNYFQVLEDTLLGFFLMPFTDSIAKKIRKHPKFYFFDTGVHRAISRKTSLELEKKTKEYGEAFEHFLIREIIGISKYADNDYEFSFYRTQSNLEVDLIIKTLQGEIYAIEIKSSNNPANQSFAGLKSFTQICPNARLFCACTALKASMQGNIEILPWQELFVKINLVVK